MKRLNRFANVYFVGLLACPLVGVAADTQWAVRGQGDDSALTSEVKSQIYREPSLKSSGIQVESAGGVVRLSGTAGSEAKILTAVQMAQSVQGVASVTNDLRVK